MTPALEVHVHERFSRALLRFAPRVREVVVRIADVNGPRGGIDKLCRATVHLEQGGTLVAEAKGQSVGQAVALAVTRTRSRVSRSLERSGRDWQQAS